jgi:hypothetical protein
MRAYLLFLAGLPLVAQTETNISCVERLEIPTYPPLAKQASIAGALTATVLLTNDASVGRISSEWTPQYAPAAKAGATIVTPVVEKSLRASTFVKSCAGKTVTLVFNFVFAESLQPREIRFSFGYPNQFWVTTPHAMVMP